MTRNANGHFLAVLDEHGWYRAETQAFVKGAVGPPDVEPVPCYYVQSYDPVHYDDRGTELEDYEGADPFVVTVDDIFEMGGRKSGPAARSYAVGHPGSLKEANDMVRLHLRGLRHFPHNYSPPPGYEPWYREAIDKVPENRHRLDEEIYTHTELWKKRGSPVEVWAVVLMKKGWRPPREAIAKAVWSRVTDITTEEFDDRFYQV